MGIQNMPTLEVIFEAWEHGAGQCVVLWVFDIEP